MKDTMTDEEIEALDELVTRTTPKVPPNGHHGFAARSTRLVALDELSGDYLYTRSLAEHKTPTQLISEWVRQSINQSIGKAAVL